MKIQRNFYTELKQDLLECSAECGDSFAQHSPLSEVDPLERLFANEGLLRLKKSANGQALTEASFERLVNQALDTAERLGLNVQIESRGTTGILCFRRPMIYLNASADALYISRLLSFLSHAAHIYFNVVSENGEMLFQLTLYYELTV